MGAVPVRGDYFNSLNALFTVVVALLVIVLILVWLDRLRRWVQRLIDTSVDRIKTELPPLLVGEEWVRQEIAEFRQRLQSVEAQSSNLERRLSRRLPEDGE